ncbi:MAG TPA: hypothetical protein VEV81_01985, partial [Pyrinomonadaceae bacterium]|nr:hypothetical protein [Pyrinomonadaceae bacterium]
PGFQSHAHHLLTPAAALKFGRAVGEFQEGRAIIGYCPGARLAVPVYETAFALSRALRARGLEERTSIIIVSPTRYSDTFGGGEMTGALRDALDAHRVGFLPNFAIARVTEDQVWTDSGLRLGYELLMLIPPFEGAGAAAAMGLKVTDEDGYVRVDRCLRVQSLERAYAVGDCVNFEGQKMGHMAVRQAEIAAANVKAEIEGRSPEALYDHEMMLVIDEGGRDSIYYQKELWGGEGENVKRGRFWGWAKHVHERYWRAQHA